ncbi:MAG: DUF4349 domain-containing protein, partial [Clostridia bacterium]
MDCRQCRENISAYIDGMLDGASMFELHQHLSQCPLCRNEYEITLKLRGMCADLEDVELPSHFCERLMNAVKKEMKVNMMKRIRWKFSRRLASGIAAAVVLVIGMALLMSGLGTGKGVYKRDMATEQAVPPSQVVSSEEGGYYSGKSGMDAMASDAGWATSSFGGTKDEAGMADVAPTEMNQGGDLSGKSETALQKDLASEATSMQALAEAQAGAERKIIRSAYLSMETTQFERTVDEIMGKVSVYLGYIESSEIQGKPIYQGQVPNRKAHFEIRIPSKSFDAFIGDMSDVGNVTSRQIRGEDITGQYLDVEARLKSLKLQEERLL